APHAPATYALSLHDALPIFDCISGAVNASSGWVPGARVAGSAAHGVPSGSRVSANRTIAIAIATTEATRPRRSFGASASMVGIRSEEHTSELQSRENLVCRL